MTSLNMPQWGVWAMALGLGLFLVMLFSSIRRHHGVHRSLFSWPYSLWRTMPLPTRRGSLQWKTLPISGIPTAK